MHLFDGLFPGCMQFWFLMNGVEMLCVTTSSVHGCIAADTLGFTTYPAAYLSPQASGQNLLIGANFASAGSGYYDHTALMYVSIIITHQ